MASDLSGKALVAFFVVVFSVIVVRNAWVSEDAYITFRTVENFVGGYGPTWNTVERVQTYTHPLWMLLLSAAYYVTHEIHYSSILLSILISVAAATLYAAKVAKTPAAAVLGITALIFSKAYIDYSTSGLENPLTHLILTAFLLIYLKQKINQKTLLLLSLTASLAAVNRLDTLPLLIPPLLYALYKFGKLKRGLATLTAGFTPLILWEMFSLIYYGFLLPNTAYAKLATCIPKTALATQGVHYLLNSLNMDPLTLTVVAAGIVLPLVTKKWRTAAVSLGITVYLVYVVSVGGDFMTGRFLTAPFLVALILITDLPLTLSKPTYILAFILVILIGYQSPYPTIKSGADYGSGRKVFGDIIDGKGISDERAYYYPHTGLLRSRRGARTPTHKWVHQGRMVAASGQKVAVHKNVGFYGYYAGPRAYIVDSRGLTDPLLSRLPSKKRWRIGHFDRVIPKGYLITLRSGENKIENRNLAAYYDKMALITRGGLYDKNRLIEIFWMNTGRYNHLITGYEKDIGRSC